MYQTKNLITRHYVKIAGCLHFGELQNDVINPISSSNPPIYEDPSRAPIQISSAPCSEFAKRIHNLLNWSSNEK